MRAAFLDRDGVINEEAGYVKSWPEFRFIPGSREAIALLSSRGCKIFVITNQSGIARGYFSEETLDEINNKMRKEIEAVGGRIDGIYYCPHLPDANCKCRKPQAAMLEQAAKEHGIDLSASYVVGDKPMDIEMGKRANCSTVLVRTGYGSSYSGPEPDLVAENLYEAAKAIVAGGI